MQQNTERVSFLTGYKANSPSELRIIRRWIDSNAKEQLSVPIGIGNSKNEIYNFEIQNKSGNGAVVGTCGSGKTEFIKTWLLSLAVDYPPSKVQFLVIEEYDELCELEPLPHCVGHVLINSSNKSNGHRIAEALKNLVVRRKLVFEKLQNDRSIYQGMPELIIVVDNLRYLRCYEENLYSQLIEVARLGHALGIKLFFTSQQTNWNDSIVDGIRLDYVLGAMSTFRNLSPVSNLGTNF